MPRTLAFLSAALLTILPAHADTLDVYTYESFVSEWGPGPQIEEAFEARCDCTIRWTAVDDAAILLSRLRLEGSGGDADVVLGLDTNLMAETLDHGLVRQHGLVDLEFDLPLPWNDPVFVPFDYGYFAVIYDDQALPQPPASLDDLVSGGNGADLIIQDPRTSTPGLGLMLWMKTVYGDSAADAWRTLSSRVLTVTAGWSEAYGLFLEGEAPMVLSYTTSPAYHQLVEGETRYRAAMFEEGHYMQIEVAAMVEGTDQEDLARDFLRFIATPEFQGAIPTGNWMYPVIDLGDDLPDVFRELPAPAVSLLLPPEEAGAMRRQWIDEWLEATIGE